MRPIDADALLEQIETERERLVKLGMLGAEHIVTHYVRNFIEDAPTIDALEVVKDMFKGEMKLMPLETFAPTVDAVEVVRCKDCRHRDPEDKKCDCGHDIMWQLPRSDEWFCADGEVKEWD